MIEEILSNWVFLKEIWGVFVSLILICILAGWLMIKTKTNFLLKLSIIPLIFILFYVIFGKWDDILGYGYPKFPDKEIIILGHISYDKRVEIWGKHPGEKNTRLYIMPFERGSELQNHLDGMEKNRRYVMEVQSKTDDRGSDVSDKTVRVIPIDELSEYRK